MHFIQSIMAVAVVGAVALPAAAQEEGRQGRRGGDRGGFNRPQQLAGEELQAAWTLQAKAFASSINMADDSTSQLVEAYTGVRESHQEELQSIAEAMRERMREARESDGFGGRGADGGAGRGARGGAGGRGGEGGDGGAGRGARGGDGGRGGDAGAGRRGQGVGARGGSPEIEQVTEKSRNALQSELSGLLSEDDLKGAMLTLGSFNRSWDQMVHTLNSFELGEESTLIALWPVQDYVAALSGARESDDREASREKVASARETMLNSLGEILNDEQLQEFRRAAGGQRGGSGGAGQPGARGGIMERLDANGDGKIQFDEVPERMQPMFERLDANGDGVLTEDEIGAAGRTGGGGGEGRGRRGGDGGGGRIID